MLDLPCLEEGSHLRVQSLCSTIPYCCLLELSLKGVIRVIDEEFAAKNFPMCLHAQEIPSLQCIICGMVAWHNGPLRDIQ